jgi:hypothetical protein
VDALILGATIGLAAGTSAGPLLFLTVTLPVLGRLTDPATRLRCGSPTVCQSLLGCRSGRGVWWTLV